MQERCRPDKRSASGNYVFIASRIRFTQCQWIELYPFVITHHEEYLSGEFQTRKCRRAIVTDRLAAQGDDRDSASLASRSGLFNVAVTGDFQHLTGAVTRVAIAVARALNDGLNTACIKPHQGSVDGSSQGTDRYQPVPGR